MIPLGSNFVEDDGTVSRDKGATKLLVTINN